ncbi:hypothetical protein SEA_MORRIGAN_59 [Microbacterium phage Morrigan]|nr:hypothetical protein SEA_MORRIGAN_59 [Microbacterium phage Morrigan]
MNLFRWLKKEPQRVASPIVFRRMVADERRRQVAKGYTPEHDKQHGPLHLLALSQIYTRLGEPVKAAALTEAAMELIRGVSVQYVDIVFDKLPGAESAVFVEVENPDGAGVRFGTWVQREDGYAALRVNYWDAIAALGIPGVRS